MAPTTLYEEIIRTTKVKRTKLYETSYEDVVRRKRVGVRCRKILRRIYIAYGNYIGRRIDLGEKLKYPRIPVIP
jgi:hypothetical protein